MVDRDEPDEHPVRTGLVALVGVGLAVGLFLGLAVLIGTQVLGLGGGSSSQEAASQQSMYLPRPTLTDSPSGPLITLAPGSTPTSGSTSTTPTTEPSPTPTKKPRKQISLSAGETNVAPMQQIDLTGVYPGGEGEILQVQRFTNGAWQDFPVTVSVSNETFSTYVQTSQGGVNRFRVVDTDTGLQSNEVRVTIG